MPAPSTREPKASALEAIANAPKPSKNPNKKKVAVIDDAFDDVELGEVTHIQYLEFRQIANEDAEFSQLMIDLALQFPEVEDGEDPPLEFIQKLWDLRKDQPAMKALIDNHLLTDKASKLAGLELICQNLSSQNLEIACINSKDKDNSIFETGDFHYVFIDYNLGVVPGPAAIANAKNKAREVYNACPPEKKPVTILMSSMPDVSAEKDKFQAESEMLEGVFRFSPKATLENISQVKLLVRAYEEEFISNHALQRYINALTGAANEALEEFKKEVRMMRIDDYVFIQNSALLDQAQPLGDYLAWLYGSHWANLLLRNKKLKIQQDIVDTVLSRTAPLHHEVPSPKVSDIYMSALFEDELSPIAYHPLLPEGQLTDKPTSILAELPYLHLGDLFTKKDSTQVWMVLNAQCDLERANEANKERSIFLVQGTLHLLNKTPLDSTYKTEFFKFEDKQYRIAWEVKKVITVPHNEFEEWQKKGSYERHHRLRLPFALEIQQAFSASVTRVGLPVSPPFTQDLEVEILFRASNGSANVLLPSNKQYAFQPITRKEDKIIRLTLVFASDFKSALHTKKTELMEQLSLLSASAEPRKADAIKYIAEAIASIEKIIDNFENLFFDKKGFNYPDSNKYSDAFKGLVSVGVDVNLKSYPSEVRNFFLFNIITKPVLEVEPEISISTDEPKA